MTEVKYLALGYRVEPVQSVAETWIHDPQNDTVAFTTTDPRFARHAHVINKDGRAFQFVPVDHNIKVLRPDGTEERHCDGMMLVEDNSYLAFVEMKDYITGGWFPEGKEQLEKTITSFNENYDYLRFRRRHAYVCNSHHGFHMSMKDDISKFHDTHHFILHPMYDIVI